MLLSQSLGFLWWPLQFIFENKTQAPAEMLPSRSQLAPQVLWLWTLLFPWNPANRNPWMLEIMVPFLNGQSIVIWPWDWLEQWAQGLPQPFPAGGWWWQNGHILIPQQWFLLCWAFSAIRWDQDLKIPIGRRNTEFQNTENSVNRASVIYVLSKHKGHCTTSFLHSAYAHSV